MNSTPIRRTVAIAGATIFITAIASTTTSSASGQQDPAQDRPCFMVRAHWNTAEGPQPTCSVPTWAARTPARVAPATVGRTTSAPSPAEQPVRRMDFMP